MRSSVCSRVLALIVVVSALMLQLSGAQEDGGNVPTIYNCSAVYGDSNTPTWSDQLTSQAAPFFVYGIKAYWGNSGDPATMLDSVCFYYSSATTIWNWCRGTTAPYNTYWQSFNGNIPIVKLTIYYSSNGINGLAACTSDGQCSSTLGSSTSDAQVVLTSNGADLGYMLGYATGESDDWVHTLQACFVLTSCT